MKREELYNYNVVNQDSYRTKRHELRLMGCIKVEPNFEAELKETPYKTLIREMVESGYTAPEAAFLIDLKTPTLEMPAKPLKRPYGYGDITFEEHRLEQNLWNAYHDKLK